MGDLLSARCRCGYSTHNLLLGGGTFRGPLPLIALCNHCHEVINVDANKLPVCPRCGKDVALYNGSGYPEHGFGGGKALYRCPKCGQNTLEFHTEGLYD
jgi:RNA polymerase subunit RPABC4/transcription elongation factor Spt4